MSERKALVLTDVVDSTRLAEQLGEAATASLWQAHDRLARDLLPQWRGREIDRTDGILVLFDTAAEAAGYAAAYRAALTAQVPQLSARIGVHVGPVVLRQNRADDVARGAKPVEVDGAAKAVAARVMSVAGGDQIIVSADARQAIGDTTLQLHSHGHWRLKGIADPVELFELVDDAPLRPPPDADKAYRVVRLDDVWLPAREIRHALPAERDAFIGRTAALAALAERFHGGARLVSVLGIGGTGKTRLVTRFGWSWLGDFPGGVWFCDLSAAQSLAGIVHAVALALEVPLARGDPVVQLGHAIAGRGSCLLILDNFEQVARHADESLGRWLDRAPDARFVVTTRERLGLPGEQTLPLPALDPDEAQALFVRRAEAAEAGWTPSADDRAAIGRLVELLDGLPLAIELAAARARLMPPRQLLARMGERFRLLASPGGRKNRQSTLRAAFDWSWDLLTTADKAALAQLSVFERGFTLESAEAVLDLTPYDDARWSTDAVQSLLDKSLLRRRSATRFDLLVNLQQYAAEHLCTEHRYPGSGAAARRQAEVRHGAWFAALGAQRAANAVDELDNLIAACRRAVARGDVERAAGALDGAWAALNLRGPFETGVELAASVCAMADLPTAAAARARRVLADALVASGNGAAAQDHYDHALADARSAGDRCVQTEVQLRLATLHLNRGRNAEARGLYQSALDAARALDDQRLEAAASNGLGNLQSNEGQFDAALASYGHALALARASGDQRMQGTVLGNLSHLHAEIGQLDEARARCEDGTAIARESGNRMLEASLGCNLGMLLLLQQRVDQACSVSRQALAMAREIGYVRLESIIQCNLGIAMASLDQPGDAHRCFDAGLAIARSLDDRRTQGQILGYRGLLHARSAEADAARRCLDDGERLLRAVSDAVGLGVLLCGRAEAAWHAGDRDGAAAARAEARTLAVQVGAGPASEFGLALARVDALCSRSGS